MKVLPLLSHKWLKSFRKLAEAKKRCPETTLFSIGDREADIYELFQLAVRHPDDGPKLLIRAEQNRLLADGHGYLWEHVRGQSLAGTQWVRVPRKGSSHLEMPGWIRHTLFCPVRYCCRSHKEIRQASINTAI